MKATIENELNYSPIKLGQLNWFKKEHLEEGMPVVDVRKLNTDEELKAFIKDVQDKKFFYVENHGIEEALIEELLNVNRAFFSLPEAEKEKFGSDVKEVDLGGYKGLKKNSVAKITGRGEFADQLMKYVFSTYKTDLVYPNDTFEKICKSYTQKVNNLIRFLLEKLFNSLVLVDSDFRYTEEIKEFFLNKGFTQNMMLLYPAVEQDEDAAERMATHFDTSLITILYQMPALGKFSEDPYIGFEVEDEGKRIPLPPVRGTFVINFGELIHHLTNGAIPATYHGVKLPSDEELPESERMTIVSFYFPDPQAKIKVSSIKGSISYNAIKNGNLKENQEVTLQELRKAMFKNFTY